MEKSIINLTKMPITRSLRDYGVFNLPTTKRVKLHDLLEFDKKEAISRTQIWGKSISIAELALDKAVEKALISPPQFMSSCLEYHLTKRGIDPVYPIVKVKSFKEKVDPDGESEREVRKSKFIVVNLMEPPRIERVENPWDKKIYEQIEGAEKPVSDDENISLPR